MCEQCQAFDDEDDLDALVAAFVARTQKPVPKAAPVAHALVYRKALAAVPRKEKPNA